VASITHSTRNLLKARAKAKVKANLGAEAESPLNPLLRRVSNRAIKALKRRLRTRPLILILKNPLLITKPLL
jgi:hypothetical protein